MAKTTRTILSITLLTALGTLAGCGGPTKAGLQARSEARDRMGLVNAQISFDQAKRAFEVGEFDRAMREVSNAIERYDRMPAYHLLHGRILLETHKLEQALKAFDRAIESASASQGAPANDPSVAQAHYFAGIVFQRWSNHEQAHERYLMAANLDASNAQYLLAAAEAMIAIGEYDAAYDTVAPRLAYFEHNAALRHLLGHIALLQGDADFASQQFAQAQLLNPDDPMLAEELAWAQYAAGRYAHCLESLQQIKFMSGVGTDSRLDLLHLEARCLMHLERHVDARKLYMQLSRLAPTDPEVWIELGALAWELGDLRRVAEAATRIIALAPERYEGYALRGIYARENDLLADAEKHLRLAVEHAPDHAMSNLLLAQVLEQRDKHEEALMIYGKVVSMHPNNREAFMLFGRLSQTPTMKQLSAVRDE